jgi:hypothetical protein
MTQSPLLSFLLKYQTSLINIDLLKELWMIPDRLTAKRDGQQFILSTESPLYSGKLLLDEADPTHFFAIDRFERVYTKDNIGKTYHVQASDTAIPFDASNNTALCTPQDPITLSPGDLINLEGTDDITSTIGIMVANYLFLVYPFGDIIPFFNGQITTSKLEKMITGPLLEGKITVDQVKQKYINTLSLIGGSCEIICPNISEKTITIPPEIHVLREQLVNDNRAALEAGDVSVMSDIEKQLIKAYRDHLRGDPSLHFLLKKKYFDVTLKKLFLTQGMTEIFGSPGKFTFVDNPMGQGWKQKDLPVIYNEVRKGSFARAVETADGGVVAKLILRVFQDTRIDLADCGTKRGEHIHGTKGTLKDFMWNYVINADGSTILITDTTLDALVGQEVVIRTPGYCQAPQGFCAKCFGNIFEKLGQKAFAPIANDLGRNFTTASLKAMHGLSHTTIDVSDLNRYVI